MHSTNYIEIHWHTLKQNASIHQANEQKCITDNTYTYTSNEYIHINICIYTNYQIQQYIEI